MSLKHVLCALYGKLKLNSDLGNSKHIQCVVGRKTCVHLCCLICCHIQQQHWHYGCHPECNRLLPAQQYFQLRFHFFFFSFLLVMPEMNIKSSACICYTVLLGFCCQLVPCCVLLSRYLTGMVDKRTLEKYEREAKEKNRETW